MCDDGEESVEVEQKGVGGGADWVVSTTEGGGMWGVRSKILSTVIKEVGYGGEGGGHSVVW